MRREGRGSGGRAEAVRVRSARRRRASSTRWLQRQLNDPYVQRAQREGLRSRAAYKIMQIDDKACLFAPGQRVVDLGAAPGGWSQVAARRVHTGAIGGGCVVALDVSDMDPLDGVLFLKIDALGADSISQIKAHLGGPADVVLSDMASPATGHAATDRLRVVMLCEAAFEMADALLAPGGSFVAKLLRGGDMSLATNLRRHFDSVKHMKPPASRSDSAEIYVVAKGFMGKSSDV